jgi:hypothetical protein
VVLACAVVAAAASVAIYYAHFVSTYRAEFTRIAHETAARAPDAGGHTSGERLRGVPYAVQISIGAPALLFAFLGGVELTRRRGADRLTLALGGWMLACVAFLALGVLTPVDMRYYLASLPAMAIAAGYGVAWSWSEGWPAHQRLWRVIAAVFLAATLSTGVQAWWGALG